MGYQTVGTAILSRGKNGINLRIYNNEYYTIPLTQLEEVMEGAEGMRLTAEIRKYDHILLEGKVT